MKQICGIALFTFVISTILGARGETVRLRGGGVIRAPILAQKPNLIVIDLGFTVVLIPRSEVISILSDEPNLGTDVQLERNDQNPRREVAISAAGEFTNSVPKELPREVEKFYRFSNSGGRAVSVKELVHKLGEAVVQVRTPRGLGSGFIINEEGYLVTNFHVVEGETEIEVEVYHQRGGQLERKTYKQVKIIALNKFDDLALLKIDDKDASKFVSVPIGSTETLVVGERVFAIGSPLGLERTVTEGIISTKTRLIQGKLYLQTTAQINPGNSGGPLFNLAGEVVGVTNMKVMYGEGLGFAIPAEVVKYFLDHRDAFAYSVDNPSAPYRYLDPPMRTGPNSGGGQKN
jgi:serine protease Do